MPVLAHEAEVYLAAIRRESAARGSDVMIGLLRFDFETAEIRNGLYSMSGAGDGWYFKRRLVPLSEFFPVQSRLAEASASVDAARLLLYRDTAQVEQMAVDGHVISVEQRIRTRRDHAFAARLSRDAVEAVFASVGGAGLSLNQPIQRMWRDTNAISRHISLNWDAVSSMVGQYLLGLEPKGQY